MARSRLTRRRYGEGAAKAQEMFVRYSDGVETIQHGEAETVEEIAATLLDIAKRVGTGSVIQCAQFTRRATV